MRSNQLCIIMAPDLAEDLRQTGEKVGLSSLSAVIRVASVKWLQEQRREAGYRQPSRTITKGAGVDPGASGEDAGTESREG